MYRLQDTIATEIQVKNTGPADGGEVVQAYIEYPKIDRMPLKELKCFKRVTIQKGAAGLVELKIPVEELQKWDISSHGWKVYPGNYKLILGSNSADEKISLPLQSINDMNCRINLNFE